MTEQNWLTPLNSGRDTIEGTIRRLQNLAWHLEESGNLTLRDKLIDETIELKIGLDDINKAVDTHLTVGAKQVWENVGGILNKLVEASTDKEGN